MPVYEYECKACHREFEYQQRMSDPDKTTCEACGGALERLISRTAFQLKGGGWYKDLYASSKPADTKADAKSEPSDSKDRTPVKDVPAAKTESSPSNSSSNSGGTSSDGGGGGGDSGGGTSSKAASAA
jgi:putative FmdB family regulatory protein